MLLFAALGKDRRTRIWRNHVEWIKLINYVKLLVITIYLVSADGSEIHSTGF